MRKFVIGVIVMALSFILYGCDEQGWSEDIPYTIAQGYFTKNVPSTLKKTVIYSKSEFNSTFGAATTSASAPTEIDFENNFVIAIMQKSVKVNQTISPKMLKYNAGVLQCAYTIKNQEELSYTIAPLLILVVSNEYADSEVAFYEM